MGTRHAIAGFAFAVVTISVAGRSNAAPDQGFRPIFDGETTDGWQAPDPSYWTVEEGAITGRITKEHPLTANQYLVWKGGPGAEGGRVADFQLVLKSRVRGEGGINNGFQFRSRLFWLLSALAPQRDGVTLAAHGVDSPHGLERCAAFAK